MMFRARLGIRLLARLGLLPTASRRDGDRRAYTLRRRLDPHRVLRRVLERRACRSRCAGRRAPSADRRAASATLRSASSSSNARISSAVTPRLKGDLLDLAVAQVAHEAGQRRRALPEPHVVDDDVVSDEADDQRSARPSAAACRPLRARVTLRCTSGCCRRVQLRRAECRRQTADEILRVSAHAAPRASRQRSSAVDRRSSPASSRAGLAPRTADARAAPARRAA